jgi:hypothetical protein
MLGQYYCSRQMTRDDADGSTPVLDEEDPGSEEEALTCRRHGPGSGRLGFAHETARVQAGESEGRCTCPAAVVANLVRRLRQASATKGWPGWLRESAATGV